MSSMPVIIAARNEANIIGHTLDALTKQAEPIVIPNGCVDQTANIAEKYGATVIPEEIEGKMTALQTGIRYLGRRAIEPFIVLDADTYPVFPKCWLNSLVSTRYLMPENEPAIVTGAVVFKGGTDAISSTYRTLRNMQTHFATRDNPHAGNVCGGNMLIHPLRGDIVDELMGLPQIWPGEDAIIKDVVVNNGGNIRKSLRVGATVFSDSSRYDGLLRRILDGKERSLERWEESYLDDAPPNSITGTEYKMSQFFDKIAA